MTTVHMVNDEPAIPSYVGLLWPTLLAVRELGGSGTIGAIDAEAVQLGRFTAAQQARMHRGSSVTELEYRLAWARTALKGMGVLRNDTRAVWSTTPLGSSMAAGEMTSRHEIYLAHLSEARRAKSASRRRREEPVGREDQRAGPQDLAQGPRLEQSPALAELTTIALLGLSRAILSELRRRGVVRTGNAPAGDYAEFLVRKATGGELAANSQKSWDVRTPSGQRLQVKARVVTDAHVNGERQLSVFRSWDFDASLIVLFDDDFHVWRAALLPVASLRDAARFIAHVSGHRVFATDDLLSTGEDWTERMRAVQG